MTEKFTEQLVSLRTQVGVTLHAYLICPPGEAVPRGQWAAEQLCSHAEQESLPYLPMILLTHLTTGGDEVREVIRSLTLVDRAKTEEALVLAKRALDGEDDYHFSLFICPTESDQNHRLMKLH